MKKHAVFKGILLASVLLLSACQNKQKEEARLTGIEQMKNKDYAGAVDSFELALGLAQGKVSSFELDVLKYRAEAEYQLEDYAAAAHTYDILLQVDAELLEYHSYRSIALAKAGDLAAAVTEYQTAAALVRADERGIGKDLLAELLINLGVILEQDAEYRETAASLYQEAISAGEASAVLYNRMGLVSLEVGEYDAAIGLFATGLTTGDGTARKDLLFNQAVAYEYKLEFQKALELLEQYVAEFGSDEAAEKEIAFLRTR